MNGPRHHCAQDAIVIGLSLFVLTNIVGCGVSEIGYPSTQGAGAAILRTSLSPDNSNDAVVVLNWDGGKNDIYTDLTLSPIDLSLFKTDTGETLLAREASFKADVLREVESILSDVPEMNIRVVSGPSDEKTIETTVHLSQEVSPTGRVEIGRADYDPCNRYYDDEAIIFGEQIHKLGDGYSYEEWVTLFANVTAHEVCHTLGYGHVARADYPPTERALYVELMLDQFTMSDMRRPQKLLVTQSVCPANSDSGGTIANGVNTAPCSCGHDH